MVRMRDRPDGVQARNEADQIAYSAEKSVSDFKDKVTPEIVAAIQAAASDVRAAKESSDPDVIKAKVDALSKAVQKIGEHMSAQGGAGKGGEQGGDGEANKASGG
jgi:molecular chaperone DnaK